MAVVLGATWDGSSIIPEFINEVRVGDIVYWNVKIRSVKYWVIRRYILDLRPVISDELKPYFRINKTGTHYYKHGNRYILLIRSRDPYKAPEVTFNNYIKNDDNVTDDIAEQARNIYVFRRMCGMTRNNNNSLIVRRVKGVVKIFSLYDSFPNNCKLDTNVPESVINRWFESGNVDFYDCLSDMLGIPRSDETDPDDLFNHKLHLLNIYIEKIVERIDIDLVWYQSDIINYIIGKVTPR